jgi:hypothetical protein
MVNLRQSNHHHHPPPRPDAATPLTSLTASFLKIVSQGQDVLTIAEDLHERGIGLRILTGTLAAKANSSSP